MSSGLGTVFVYLVAAVIAVPLSKRLGLGSFLGYLLAGIVIGPAALGLVSEANDGVMHIAEFGVVMMLFLIGLELKPELLWESKGTIFGMGFFQLIGTAAAGVGGGLACGLNWKEALAVGMIFSMSSTAIGLQSLREERLLKTRGGEASFSILLFQDLAVIPIISLLPLLASRKVAMTVGEPGWQKALYIGGAVVFVVILGRFFLPYFFRFIARTGLREIFTSATLLLVVGVVMLMEKVGLSPALGAFLAGVLLADSEYRVQLETDIEPFKGLLLGLFFISVGAGIDFGLIAERPLLIATLVLAVLVVKTTVLVGVGSAFRLGFANGALLTLTLAPGGEFAFVLFSYAAQNGVLSAEMVKMLIATTALSMAFSPFLFLIYDRFVADCKTQAPPERPADAITEENPVILAGFGRFGNIVGRLLRANGIGTTVLDHDPDQVERLGRFGLRSFYGDASRLDLLRAAQADRARLFILAIEDEAKSLEIVRLVQKHFPNLKILARATSRQHAYDLLNLGVKDVFRETLGSALDLSAVALQQFGRGAERTRRAVELFREHDEASVRELAKMDSDSEAYISRARQDYDNLVRALQSDEALVRGDGQVETDEVSRRLR
jgi:monovalent cation:proton antiporter-2 (CPA2) family protein